MTRRGEGEATFQADGKTWRLRFDFNAMADFEAETGKRIFDVLEGMEEGAAKSASASDVRALFWAMLREHHPDVTLRDAGRMVTQGMEALNAAALSALPSPEPESEESDAEKPKAATGRAALTSVTGPSSSSRRVSI